MKVLITGGLGFIGSQVVRKFVAEKHEVVVFDNCSYSGFVEHIADVPGVTIYKGDLKKRNNIDDCFVNYGPFDLVLHLAAESAVDKSIKIYDEFILTNILGTANLLSVCNEYGVKRIISTGTDEIFGHLSVGDQSFNENTPIRPRNIYSASKAGQVHIANAFKETYGTPIIQICPSNCYGPRQLPEKLLPRMIYLLKNGKELPVYGTGKNIREWLFVEDAAEAFYCIAEKGVVGQLYTVGSDNEKTNIDIIHTLANVMGVEPNIKFVEDRKGHDFRYSVSSSKIKDLGWKTSYTLEEGLKKTVAWYDENYAWLETNYKKVWPNE